MKKQRTDLELKLKNLEKNLNSEKKNGKLYNHCKNHLMI